jgi:hypothetical protein
MKTYKVSINYTVRVQADDEEDAQEQAWSALGDANPNNEDYFDCTVDEVEGES